MKISQTECEKPLSEETQKQQPTISASILSSLPIAPTSAGTGLLSNDENVLSNNAVSAARARTKMTDEHNNNSNKNERIIAEAAKILLKNGLNGTNPAAAAAATLLTAATFQLPAPPSSTLFQPPPAHLGSPVTTSTAAAVITPGCHSSLRSTVNNGLSSSTSSQFTPTKDMATVTSAAAVRLGTESPPTATHIGNANVKSEIGVIDYTVKASGSLLSPPPSSATVNNSGHKIVCNSDIGRNSISSATGGSKGNGSGYGGRLQFFKDGKFILELARSKDGEKGGWVSVPRKQFRSPSATSSTVTPTSATITAYPKNECSTSLSFSDDNSSIQSSPWQRDHCWKQQTPRRGISKEMTLLYRRPKGVTLSPGGFHVAYKKRRKPYDASCSIDQMFEHIDRTHSRSHNETSCKGEEKQIPQPKQDEVINTSIKKEESETKATNNGNTNISEEDGCSSSSTATLTGNENTDAAEENKKRSKMAKTDIQIKQEDGIDSNGEEKDGSFISINIKTEEGVGRIEDKEESTPKEKISTNTSDGDEPMAVIPDEPKKLELNGDSNNQVDLKEMAATMTTMEKGEQKRLKKIKTRAKLTAIIQKLIDTMPIRSAPLSKTLLLMSGSGGGAITNHTNSPSHKVSPPNSSASTSRLVEYHQQHVSPRKRILREFEKVSLEDNTATAAGGKRSRAKNNAKSPPNRLQSTSYAAPVTMALTSALASNDNLNATSASSKTKPQTRLYSSYSIHSLLGGSSSTSSSAKKSSDQAIVSNISYHHHQQQQQQTPQHYTDPSYLRTMLASPKSPEGTNSCGGGKSPSNSGSKKRSPPYASPLHEAHSRSPIMAHAAVDYGRRSPRTTPPETTNYKMRFAAEHSSFPNAAHSPSHHLQQHQQGFYSPYMMSPKYVPAPSTSISPNSNITSVARSPRHSSAFSSTSANASSSSVSTHIPNSSSVGSMAQRELSPPRSSTASPRESTPRTVPKKTASIRRQFASPTASTTNSCPSPSDRTSEEVTLQDRKTPVANAHMIQRNPAAPLHYYMYPPPPNGSLSPHSAPATPATSNASAAAYIPSVVPASYYHPYISTLAALRHNSMWMHHFHGTAPPVLPFHSFPYNGVGAAAVAAAFGSAQSSLPPATHMTQSAAHQHMMAPAASVLHGGAGVSMGRGRTQSPKLTDHSAADLPTVTKSSAATATTQLGTASATIFPSRIKDEHSSDVPLNLSKH